MTDGRYKGGPLESNGGDGAVCASVRDDLAPYLLGGLPDPMRVRIRAHLDGCEACADEAAFLARVTAEAPVPPSTLTASVLARVQEGRVASPRRTAPAIVPFRRTGRSRRSLLWGLPAAAMVILSLGVALFWNGSGGPESPFSLAFEAPAEGWGEEEWLVAGAPHLAGLSDEVLLALMEEFD